MKFLALTLMLWNLHVAAQEIPRPAVVRFNTVCANCHEGECSGRLSFQSGADAARGHMERYLGKITSAEGAALFSLLRYTKEHCSHYPVTAAWPEGGVWNTAELTLWRNQHEGGYFVPLGKFASGSHRLQITFAATAPGRLKITDDRFEPLVEEALCPDGMQEVRFIAPGGPLYMTLQTKAELIGIRLIAASP